MKVKMTIDLEFPERFDSLSEDLVCEKLYQEIIQAAMFDHLEQQRKEILQGNLGTSNEDAQACFEFEYRKSWIDILRKSTFTFVCG